MINDIIQLNYSEISNVVDLYNNLGQQQAMEYIMARYNCNYNTALETVDLALNKQDEPENL